MTSSQPVVANDHRLVGAVDFEKGIVWIKWIGILRILDASPQSQTHSAGSKLLQSIKPHRDRQGRVANPELLRYL